MASYAIRRNWFGWRQGVAKSGIPAQTGYNKFTAAQVVTISYDEPLRAAPAVAQFTATVDGVARTVSGVSTSGSKLLVTLAAPALVAGAKVVITYVKDAVTATNRLADPSTAEAANFAVTVYR